MARVKRRYNEGYVTARDRAELSDGELQQATGAFYKKGDPLGIHKIPGRSEFADTDAPVRVDGVALLQFDDADKDIILALANQNLYTANAITGGLMRPLGIGFSGATTLDVAHHNDRHYVALGVANRVIETGGATPVIRGMGMIAPETQLTAVASDASGTAVQTDPDDETQDTFTPEANAWDGDDETFASATVSEQGDVVTGIYTFSADEDVSENRKINVSFSVSRDVMISGWSGPGWQFAQGRLGREIKVEIHTRYDSSSEDDWTEVMTLDTDEVLPLTTVSTSFANGRNTNKLDIRVRLTMLSLSATRQFIEGLLGQDADFNIHMHVHGVKVINGATGGTFDISNVRYAYTEFDGARNLESAPSNVSLSTTKTAINQVLISGLPATAENSNTTLYKLYRTPNDGTVTQLGFIANIPVGETTFIDDFIDKPYDLQAAPVIPFIAIEDQGSVEYYPRNTRPPVLSKITSFKGALVGKSDDDPRTLFYSIPGFPEYWPQGLYLIAKFSLPEHDEIVDHDVVGNSLLVAMKGAMLRLDVLPQAIGQTYVATPPEQIRGAPGCVGPYAMAVINYRGLSHGAWITAEDGILVTDGHEWDSISDDIDWEAFDGMDKSRWVLHWIKGQRILVMSYSSVAGGGNDRMLFFHLDKGHVKQGGRAKVTGPHYGSVSDLASGQINGSSYIYSAHWSDGKVYREFDRSTGEDASKAFDPPHATHRMMLKSPRRYLDGRAIEVHDGFLYHSNFGEGETATVEIEAGRDSSDESSVRSQQVSMNGHKRTQFDIARGGEWVEERIIHDGSGSGYVQRLDIRADAGDEEGEQE